MLNYFYYMVKVSMVLLVTVFCKGYLRPFKVTRKTHTVIGSHSDLVTVLKFHQKHLLSAQA